VIGGVGEKKDIFVFSLCMESVSVVLIKPSLIGSARFYPSHCGHVSKNTPHQQENDLMGQIKND